MWNNDSSNHSSKTATAANLRWRARVNQGPANDDDSSIAVIGAERNKKYDDSTDQRVTLLVNAAAATLAATAVYALPTTRSWWMALTTTLNVGMAVVIVWQQYTLRSFQRQRDSANSDQPVATTYELRQLQQQKDRLYQQLGQLEQACHRVDAVQSELSKLSRDDCIERVQEFRRATQRLQELLRQAIAQSMVESMVAKKKDSSADAFGLTAQEVERLILTLSSLESPGVITVQETELRRVLDGESSLEAMARLLLQVLDPDKVDDERVFSVSVERLLLAVQETSSSDSEGKGDEPLIQLEQRQEDV